MTCFLVNHENKPSTTITHEPTRGKLFHVSQNGKWFTFKGGKNWPSRVAEVQTLSKWQKARAEQRRVSGKTSQKLFPVEMVNGRPLLLLAR